VRAVAREELSDAPAETCDFAHDLAADTSRIRRELDYREESSFEAGLRDSVDWERAHPIERKGVG
jgi:nucleoside-diphosphate-sugar epimerase